MCVGSRPINVDPTGPQPNVDGEVGNMRLSLQALWSFSVELGVRNRPLSVVSIVFGTFTWPPPLQGVVGRTQAASASSFRVEMTILSSNCRLPVRAKQRPTHAWT